MSEPDEYDAYFIPIDPEELAAIEAAAIRALSHHVSERELSNNPDLPSPSPPSPDEFDAYDLSEFTAEDFALIDEMVLAARARKPESQPSLPQIHASEPGSGRSVDKGGTAGGRGSRVSNGGPSIEITLERTTNADPYRRLKDSWMGAYPKRSPYEQFRGSNGLLSVTDLASPSWCEVQFDYGLRQRRSRKLADRPTSFVSAEGKTINVTRTVAAINDRTLTSGKSVHKVLEREFQPELVPVDIITDEERWALRIVNILTSFQTLMELGRCREMPVFGIVHGQVVTGMIDEVVRIPIFQAEPDKNVPGSGPHKRPAPQTVPNSPAKPSSKKSRSEAVVDQPEITAFFPSTSHNTESDGYLDVKKQTTPLQPETQLPSLSRSYSQVVADVDRFSLHLSDTKTRIRPTLPPEEDTFASRIQLMLYHRLLSNLLSTGESRMTSNAPFEFDVLWREVKVDPTRRFSNSFLTQTGLSPPDEDHAVNAGDQHGNHSGLYCLNDLTSALKHAVEALNVTEIDETLTLVYRLQPSKRRSKRKQKATTRSSPTLSEQEAEDLARAIQASVSDVQPGTGGDDDLSRAIFESLKDSLASGESLDGDLGIITHPFGPTISEISGLVQGERKPSGTATPVLETLSDDPEFAWALQDSILAHIKESPVVKEAIPTISASGVETSVVGEDESIAASESPEMPHEVQSAPSVNEEPTAAKVPAAAQPPPDNEGENEDGEMDLTAAELDTEAKILGTKEFALDDSLLDEYLTRVLSWWRGERPPEGVDVELTRRCVTCEYRDDCEWREKKAQEALQRYKDRSGSSLGSGSAVAAWL